MDLGLRAVKGLILILLLYAASCASKPVRLQYGVISDRGEKLTEVTSDGNDGFFRGAFEYCRQKFNSGYKMISPPVQQQSEVWGLTGLIHCEGDLDLELARRFEAESTARNFQYISGPRPDRTYFEITTQLPGPH